MSKIYSRKGYWMMEKLSVQDFQANIKLYLGFTIAAAHLLLHWLVPWKRHLVPWKRDKNASFKELIKDDCKSWSTRIKVRWADEDTNQCEADMKPLTVWAMYIVLPLTYTRSHGSREWGKLFFQVSTKAVTQHNCCIGFLPLLFESYQNQIGSTKPRLD